MKRGEARQCGDDLGDFRIIFHCAGTEGIKVGIESEVSVGEFGKMAHDIKLADFGQGSRLSTREIFRKSDGRHIQIVQGYCTLTVSRLFED